MVVSYFFILFKIPSVIISNQVKFTSILLNYKVYILNSC